MAFNEYEKEIKNEEGAPVPTRLVDKDNASLAAAIDSDGHLQVDIISGSVAGEQYADGDVNNGTEKGNIALGSDGSNYKYINVDTDGHLQIDALTLPDVTLASQTSPFTNDINVSLDGELVDISDNPTRDLGKIDIAAFDVALPTGTNSIGAVTQATHDSFNANANMQVGNTDVALANPVPSRLTDGTNNVTVLDDSGTYRLEVSAKIAAGGASQDVHPVDANGVNLDVVPNAAVPANTRALLIAGYDEEDDVRVPFVIADTEDGIHRMAVQGKISISAPTPPAASTAVTVPADTPLNVSGAETEDYEITTGETFTIQQITAGAEGDPTEKGAVVRVSYLDSGGTEHIIEQIYLTGQTVQIFPDTSTARDGTALVGFAGAGNGTIRIEREQFGGGSRELDVVLRGFEQ